MKSVNGWWFASQPKLPNGDDRPVVIGETHVVSDKIILCESGLHASRRILDALSYAQGSLIYSVELSGEIIEDDNKMVASHRKYLAGGIDCRNTLRQFSCLCALDVIHLWDAPDIVKQYLETNDESISNAAWNAARAARNTASNTWAAAWDAANAAAWAASTTRNAAGNAAWDAANAAWNARAASNTARNVVRDANAAAEDAASTTRSAAGDKQNKRLEKMIRDLLEQMESEKGDHK